MQTEQAPLQEQEICVCCGFCCDATLFVHAVLNHGEKGQLPALIEQNVFSQGEKDFFSQPCLYFSDRCTLYHSRRADVCGTYRCRLLRDMAEGKIFPDEAREIIRRARLMRSELMMMYSNLTGRKGEMPFRMILRELGKRSEISAGGIFQDPQFELLLTRCNIFEALLIKYFRSTEDFAKLVMK